MTNVRWWAAVAGSMALALAAPAMAQVSGVTISGGAATSTNPSYTYGYSFTATQARTVIGLGLYDVGADGLAVAHPVGLWDSSGNLVASATVASGQSGLLLNSFRYATLSNPYVLTVGSTYTVGAFQNNSSADYIQYGSGVTVTPAAGITYNGSRFASASGIADPTTNPGITIFGGNILLATPEPSAWSLMIVGFGIVGGTLRRRPSRARRGTLAA